jgi:hypothetical protein
MKNVSIKIIEDFVNENILENSKYLWLSNFGNYGTMFKTNQNAKETSSNIISIIDEYLGEEITVTRDANSCVVLIITGIQGDYDYKLMDYTNGVVESKNTK